MWRILFIILIIVGFAVAIGLVNKPRAAAEPVIQDQNVPIEVATASTDFNETGTLVFYPNNVGPVPYLFYQDEKGNTVAKALVFPDQAPNDFSSWTGTHIRVTGIVDAEHVVVGSVAYISGP